MCGIAGIIGDYNIDLNQEKDLVMLMRNRGPDANGKESLKFRNNRNITFYFSRLSIIDLNHRSNQPFTKYNKTIIFNGEIYNYLEIKKKLSSLYSFETESDTEVLITAYHHYGIKFLDHLEGMWSLSIYDKEKNQLILSRDRFGEKPLYYYSNNDFFVFGSEINYIRKILKNNLSLNQNKLESLLCYGYRTMFNNDETFLDNIKIFPKANVWTIDQDIKVQSKISYWNLATSPNIKKSYEEFCEEVEKSLIKSIDMRLRSDVKVGISLSGGIDSSLIAGITSKKLNKNLNTFSIIDKDERYNESKNIDLIKNELSITDSFDINISENGFLDNLKNLVEYHCSPVLTISSYINSFIAKKAKENGNKVILSGIGADELFLGYYYHYLYWLNDKFVNQENYDLYIKEWQAKMGTFVENPLIKDVDKFNNDSSNRDHLFNDADLFKNLFKNKIGKNPYIENNYSNNLLRNRMLNDLFKDVVPVVLHQEDLNYMYSSVENRCPYLDKELASLANQIPNKFVIKDGYTKPILRDICKKYLPGSISNDLQKRGFNASIETLFNLNKKDNVEFCLEKSEIFEIIDRNKIEFFLKKDFKSNSLSKFLFIFLSTKIFIDYIND